MKRTDQDGRDGWHFRATRSAETSIIRLSGIDGTRPAKCNRSAISRLGTDSGDTTPFGSRILAPLRVEIRSPRPLGARARTLCAGRRGGSAVGYRKTRSRGSRSWPGPSRGRLEGSPTARPSCHNRRREGPRPRRPGPPLRGESRRCPDDRRSPSTCCPSLIPDGALRGGVAVVIDVLRATTTMVHALGAGCDAIIPCDEVDEARTGRLEPARGLGACWPASGGGLKIEGFELGNSPGDCTPQACSGPDDGDDHDQRHPGDPGVARARERVLVGAFVNLKATDRGAQARPPCRSTWSAPGPTAR